MKPKLKIFLLSLPIFFFAVLSFFLASKLYKLSGSLKEKQCPTSKNPVVCESGINETQLKPLVKDGKLTTPLLNTMDNGEPSESTSYIITTALLPGWKYGSYYFPTLSSYYDGFIPTYNLSIENIKNPDYKLYFGVEAIEYGTCDFTSNVDEENVFTMNVPVYKEIQSDFGAIRYGKTLPKNEVKPFYIVCQKSKSGQWNEYNGFSVIHIKTPENEDLKLLDEIVQMIKLAKVTTF